MGAQHSKLLEAVNIGPKTMRNRFFQVATNTGLARYPKSAAAFHATRAKGGWAVVSVDPSSIHPESDHTPMHEGRLWETSDVNNFAIICEAIHTEGALACIELVYGGSFGTSMQTRAPSRGVSQIVDDRVWYHSCYQMSKADIKELQQFYVKAARNAQDAGFDVISIHGMGGASIPHQFLMPFYNKRSDEYGGEFINRARFYRETLELVKEAVGADCAIGTSFGFETNDDEIRAEEEGIAFISLCDDIVDVWDLRMGRTNSYSPVGLDIISGRYQTSDNLLTWLSKVKSDCNKPVIGVDRYIDANMMIEALESTSIDLIGGARIAIADPNIPNKILQDRASEIIPCVGCNICISRFSNRAGVACPQNVTAGEEFRRRWYPEQYPKYTGQIETVLIVGAGLSGLECSRVLGERGIKNITLVDSRPYPGGHLAKLTELPRLNMWESLIDYRIQQIDTLDNVQLKLNTHVDVNYIRDHGADVVILATGAHWATDGMNGPSHDIIPGADISLDNCLTPDQILYENKTISGKNVFIYDADGYYVGVALAEKIAKEGKNVTYVTPLEVVDNYSATTEEAVDVVNTLTALGVDLFTSKHVTNIEPGLVTGCELLSIYHEYEWDNVESIVLITQRNINDGLYQELISDQSKNGESGIKHIYKIGDCVAPRLIEDLVFDGYRLACELENNNPMAPSQYLREHRRLGAKEADYGVLPSTMVT